MKRSEMINGLNEYFRDINAEEVLNYLERMGMVPPPTEDIKINPNQCDPSWLVNEWEPE